MSIRLSPLFSDNMVLQRNARVTLWGKADQSFSLRFQQQSVDIAPDASGGWSAELSNLKPGGPFTMQIGEIVFHHVYVGDVWLCTGQSNMQLAMDRVQKMFPDEAVDPCRHIAQFTVVQRTNFHGPMEDLDGGQWIGASPDTIEQFSAAGYFFAKRLVQRYNVPIGLILCAIGGTPIHAWMSRESLSAYPELINRADQCKDDAYIKRVQTEETAEVDRFFREIDETDPGLDARWHDPDCDDTDWPVLPLLTPLEGTGSFWFRKTLTIPEKLDGMPAQLFLGTIKDHDRVYVNGQLVGTTDYRYPLRDYKIPALTAGKCVIAIRVICLEGGGFTPGKQYLLSTALGSFDLNGDWRVQAGGHTMPYKKPTSFHYVPTSLYNGMFAPLKRLAITGAIWYQGEADTLEPERYADKYEAMIQQWRKDFGFEFPFCFVELAHWGEGAHWDALRAQQRLTLRVPKTAMAAAFDLGEHNDLHPLGKQVVGDRLAHCAMHIAYGETLNPSPFEVVLCTHDTDSSNTR